MRDFKKDFIFYNSVFTKVSLHESWKIFLFYVVTNVLLVFLLYDTLNMVTRVTEIRRCN
jgi:hypothetical protein